MKKKLLTSGMCILGASIICSSAIYAKEQTQVPVVIRSGQAAPLETPLDTVWRKKKDKEDDVQEKDSTQENNKQQAPQVSPTTPKMQPQKAQPTTPTQPMQPTTPKQPTQQNPAQPNPSQTNQPNQPQSQQPSIKPAQPSAQPKEQKEKPAESSNIFYEDSVYVYSDFFNELVNLFEVSDIQAENVFTNNEYDSEYARGAMGADSTMINPNNQGGSRQGNTGQQKGSGHYLPGVAEQIQSMVDNQHAVKLNPNAYIVQHEDGLWLVMGNIKAKLDILIYVDQKNMSEHSLDKTGNMPIYR